MPKLLFKQTIKSEAALVFYAPPYITPTNVQWVWDNVKAVSYPRNLTQATQR